MVRRQSSSSGETCDHQARANPWKHSMKILFHNRSNYLLWRLNYACCLNFVHSVIDLLRFKELHSRLLVLVGLW
jgi:hypothetical protein